MCRRATLHRSRVSRGRRDDARRDPHDHHRARHDRHHDLHHDLHHVGRRNRRHDRHLSCCLGRGWSLDRLRLYHHLYLRRVSRNLLSLRVRLGRLYHHLASRNHLVLLYRRHESRNLPSRLDRLLVSRSLSLHDHLCLLYRRHESRNHLSLLYLLDRHLVSQSLGLLMVDLRPRLCGDVVHHFVRHLVLNYDIIRLEMLIFICHY